MTRKDMPFGVASALAFAAATKGLPSAMRFNFRPQRYGLELDSEQEEKREARRERRPQKGAMRRLRMARKRRRGWA